MNLRIAVLGVAVVCQSLICSSAWPASFSCNATGLTPVEQMICHDASLSALDSKLASTYVAARKAASATELTDLISAQRAWIKQRNRCSDVSCITAAYTARIKEVAASIGPATPSRSASPSASSPQTPTAGDLYKLQPSSVTVTLPDTSYQYNQYMKIHHSIMFTPTGVELKDGALSRIQGRWWIDPLGNDNNESVVLLDCAAKTKNGAPATGYDLEVLEAACNIKVTVITVAEQQKAARQTDDFLTYWKLTGTGVSGGRYVCYYISKDKQHKKTLLMDNRCPTYQPMVSAAP